MHRLVENPITLTFKQILQQFDQITAPVTLVCAGNRRKEQNQVRKSKGFSWGAAGVSTALFTGPMMADIIRRAKPLRRARYVCMEGADKLVRQLLSMFWVLVANVPLAQWLLWDVSEAELGDGPQQRYYACPQNERRGAPP